MIYFDLLYLSAFAILSLYVIYDYMTYERKQTQKKIQKHIDSLPKKREDRPGPNVKNPDMGTGKFDKQRVVYTDGDNT